MNFLQCANCLLHGWKEVADPDTLQRCKRCKVIQYCGRDCQTVHWLKVHHKHCKYFADPLKAQRGDHKPEDCLICRQEAAVGIAQLMQPDNPYYSCIFEEMKKFPPEMPHPVPFTPAGDPGDLYEKSTIVLLQLLMKFQLTQPGVVSNCQDEFRKVFRLIPEPFQLWKIILLMEKMWIEVRIMLRFNELINPLANIPAELHADVSEAMSNSVEFLATANQVLDALARRVIPFQEVLAILCGGSLVKTCSFCNKQITIADVALRDVLTTPFAIFGFGRKTMYCCNSNSYCYQKANSTKEDLSRSVMATFGAGAERGSNRCDFCFKLPPITEVHRCSKCLSVMYCSTDCRDQDFQIHKKVCKEDTEERKKKIGKSARRKEGRDALESLEERLDDIHFQDPSIGQEVSKVLDKFKLKKSTKKSDK